jgi:hypothetical protein
MRLLAPLVVTSLALLQGACIECKERRMPKVTPSIYLIPEGFTGWVTIEYEVADAPPLPFEDGHRLFIIPRSGRLETSSPQELGRIVRERYYYVHADGRRTPIRKPESEYGASGDVAAEVHPAPVILASGVGSSTGASGRHVYEQFHVGRGPAADPPGWTP